MVCQLRDERNNRDVEFLLLNRNDSELRFLGWVLAHLWIYVTIWGPKTCYRNEDDDVEDLLYDLYSTMSDSVCGIIMNIEDA